MKPGGAETGALVADRHFREKGREQSGMRIASNPKTWPDENGSTSQSQPPDSWSH
jgi:hypothetical protein